MSTVPSRPAPPGLGPHCVGLRVVVRRVLPGERGPTGGPAMTDLLGVMESWDAVSTVVRAEDGTATQIALADIVSGKPVPPRPSPRMRISAEDLCRLSNASWPAVHTRPLGDWLLRASGGFSARASSVMATGDPGVPFEEALRVVTDFSADHGQAPWAQVVVGSSPEERFDRAGWGPARPGEADTELQLASVAQAARAVRRMLPRDVPAVEVRDRLTPQWLADDARALAHHDAAVAVLEGAADIGFASVPADDGAAVVARGRVAVHGHWAGVTDVWVSPARRRRGLGVAVLAALLERAAEHGASTVYLQVRADNAPALALYGTLGFRLHHTYRYLAAAGSSPG